MKFLSSLPENSLPLSQEELKLYCQVFYRNFTGEEELELDLGEEKTFEEILEKIRCHDNGQETILELTHIMPPGVLYKLAVDLEVEIYAIEDKRRGNWGENPSFSFFSVYTAFFLVIPPKQ